MPVFGGTTEQATKLQRYPNMPELPQRMEQVLVYLRSLERAIVDFHATLADRLQFFVQVSDNAAFGAADTTKAVTFNSPVDDDDYRVILGGSWNTKLWSSSLSTTGFTINASDAPGGGGGTVYWLVVR